MRYRYHPAVAYWVSVKYPTQPVLSELSTAFSHSLEMGETLDDMACTIHAHPTLGEAVQEAAMRALGHPLHI